MPTLSTASISAGMEENSTRQPQHILQTDAWGRLKSRFGWQAETISNDSTSVQILFRALPLGYNIAYIPKAPITAGWDSLLPAIEKRCRAKRAVFLQVEPDRDEPLPPTFRESHFPDFFVEEHTIQPRRTIIVDLSPSEEEILAAMKQKTRYNIRLAEKKGVTVRPVHDIEDFYALSETTAQRDAYAIHSKAYYQAVLDLFGPSGQCVLLQAEHEGQPLAALMLFILGGKAWYFYGASDDHNRNLMPTYLLQWEAMRLAKARGAISYDLWGIPDEDEAVLEEQFTSRSDGLWGVYRFKRGFGGQVVRSAPAFIRVYQPLIYKAYQFLRQRRQGGASEAA